MPFTPEYTHEEVEKLIDEGGLNYLEVYRLKHQHPWNQATHYIGIPMIVFGLFWPAYTWLARGYFDWKTLAIWFVVGWIFQFIGHGIEGNQPAFFRNPLHLVMGPVFIVAKPFVWIYEKATGRKVWKTDRQPAA